MKVLLSNIDNLTQYDTLNQKPLHSETIMILSIRNIDTLTQYDTINQKQRHSNTI